MPTAPASVRHPTPGAWCERAERGCIPGPECTTAVRGDTTRTEAGAGPVTVLDAPGHRRPRVDSGAATDLGSPGGRHFRWAASGSTPDRRRAPGDRLGPGR